MTFRDRIIRRAVAALAVGGLLLVGPVGVASAHGSHGDDHDGYRSDHRYSSTIKTTTDLRVYDRYACAYVWSYKGKPSGTVTFTLYGRYSDSETVYLRYGKACVGLSGLHPGSYKLTARYNGYGPYLSSWDSEYFKVYGHGYYDHGDRHGYDPDKYDHHDSYYKHDDHKYDDSKKYEHHGDYGDKDEDGSRYERRDSTYDPKKCEEFKDSDYSKVPDWCKKKSWEDND